MWKINKIDDWILELIRLEYNHGNFKNPFHVVKISKNNTLLGFAKISRYKYTRFFEGKNLGIYKNEFLSNDN